MKISAHAKAVLLNAEKIIKAKKSNKTIGSEIEETRLELLDEKTKAEYIELYNQAKKSNPEIWECDAYNLPDEAFYNNRDFFELLFDIGSLQTLCAFYPEHKEELKELWAAGKFEKLDMLYWHSRWFVNNHDEIEKWGALVKGVDETLEKRRGSTKILEG